MCRALLIMISMLLLVGVPAEVGPPFPDSVAALTASAADDCHCCPNGDEDEGDCCDWDFGACCATGTAAALSTARRPVPAHRSALPEAHGFMAVHQLRPRDNGPPPTPPPIG